MKVIKTPVNFDEICKQTEQIGKMLGVKNNAEKILSETKYRVDSLKKICSNLPKNKIFFQIGAEPVFTVLPHTFMNDFILFCNGENIAYGMTRGINNQGKCYCKKSGYNNNCNYGWLW